MSVEDRKPRVSKADGVGRENSTPWTGRSRSALTQEIVDVARCSLRQIDALCCEVFAGGKGLGRVNAKQACVLGVSVSQSSRYAWRRG
jgi:hypothetical protein